jgi:DNA-binding transcriptional LysR family regulator
MPRMDLNLLVALDALLQERSVSKAALRLQLSQPALSASLARLRRHFDDALLIRVGNGYELSPLASRLLERTSGALLGVEQVFDAQALFDPATLRRTFTVLGSDYPMAMLGERVATIVAEQAPQATIRFEHHSTARVSHAATVLRQVDAMLLPHGVLTGLPYADLYDDSWLILAASGNERIGWTITMDDLRHLPWVLSYHAPSALIPAVRQLQLLGVDPDVHLVVESFLALPAFIANSPRITLMQRGLAERLNLGEEFRLLECPFPAVPLTEALWWHPVHESDLEHAWLRGVFQEAGQSITPVG